MRRYVCMYVSADCAMQFFACVCISATLAQYNPMLAYVCPTLVQLLRNSMAKMCPGDDYGPGLLPGPTYAYTMTSVWLHCAVIV